MSVRAPLRVVSLFAGIGGFDLGFTQAGMKVVAHVEKDPHCRKLLAAKWPDAVVLDDVCTAGAHNLPPCDVICGGWPCQDLSVAGLRAGLVDGKRSNLFYELTRLIRELRPRYFIGENVPGLFSSDGGRDFARVLGELGNCGKTDIAWRTFDAQWFGVAQRRRRVFIVADFGGERASEILSIPQSMSRDSAPRRETRQDVAGTLGGSSQSGGFRTTDLDNNGAFICAEVAGCLQERDAKGADSDMKPGHFIVVKGARLPAWQRCPCCDDFWCNIHQMHTADCECPPIDEWETDPYGLQKEGPAAMQVTTHNNTGQGWWNESDLATTLRADGGDVGGGSENAVAIAFRTNQTGAQGPIHSENITDTLAQDHPPAVCFKPSFYTRCKDGAPSEVYPPLSADADKGDQEAVVLALSFSHQSGGDCRGLELRETSACLQVEQTQAAMIGSAVRRLTPKECERLQGFPDDWTAGFADSTRYRMLGNAVAVCVARWIGLRLVAAPGAAAGAVQIGEA